MRALVDEYRSRCLWFLKEGYYPHSIAEQVKVLRSIETYGDRGAFQRARELRKWLSHLSSETSADS
jgi:hypothetical protein